MDSNRDEMIDVTQAFLREFRKDVALNVHALLSSREAFEEFLREWTDTLLEQLQACETADGSPYGVLAALLNELAKSQIEMSVVRAGGYGQAN
jgi:hypothetical protein